MPVPKQTNQTESSPQIRVAIIGIMFQARSSEFYANRRGFLGFSYTEVKEGAVVSPDGSTKEIE